MVHLRKMKDQGAHSCDITHLLGSQRPQCDLYANWLSCDSEGRLSSVPSVQGVGSGLIKGGGGACCEGNEGG